jgi:hypothetical protein
MAYSCEQDQAKRKYELMHYSVLGCYIAWRLRKQSKLEWLSSNRTQKGQDTDISLL